MTFLRYLSALPLIVAIIELVQRLTVQTIEDPTLRELVDKCRQLVAILRPQPKPSQLVGAASLELVESMGTEEFERPFSDLYAFPMYMSREAFREAHGYEPPPFDFSRPVQRWFDPSAKGKRIVRYDVAAVDSNGYFVYDPLNFLEFDLGVTRSGDQAAVPNIPTRDEEQVVSKKAEEPVPLILSRLKPTEKCMMRAFTGPALPVVRDLAKMAEFEDDQPGYGVADRKLLREVHTAVVKR